MINITIKPAKQNEVKSQELYLLYNATTILMIRNFAIPMA